ncbi:MAG: hypothetical protein CMJ46_13490 [Planctomyces sp.]|nr:hypothetical protein [Planctomyces sp.]
MSMMRAAVCILAGCDEGPTDWVGDRVVLHLKDGSAFASASVRGYLVKYDGDGAIIENDGAKVFAPRENIKTIANLSDLSSGDDFKSEAGSAETGSSETWQRPEERDIRRRRFGETGSVELRSIEGLPPPNQKSPLRIWMRKEAGSTESGSDEINPF